MRLPTLRTASPQKRRLPVPLTPRSRRRDQPLTEKAAGTMLPARTPGDDEPRRPDGDSLSMKALLLLIIAGGVAVLYAHNAHLGAAAVAAITVLALLWKIIS